jgi:hypothetical protein
MMTISVLMTIVIAQSDANTQNIIAMTIMPVLLIHAIPKKVANMKPLIVTTRITVLMIIVAQSLDATIHLYSVSLVLPVT